MNSSTEDQLTHELQLLTAEQPFSPNLDSITRRAQLARRRSVVVRSTAIVGAAAGATAIVLAATGAPAGQAGRPSPSVHAILARAGVALSAASQNSVERIVDRGPDEISYVLDDQPDQVSAYTYFSAGHKVFKQMSRLQPGTKGTYVNRLVNYQARTWSELTSVGSDAHVFPSPATMFRKYTKPSRNGPFRVVGSAVVDGIPAYVLRETTMRGEFTNTIWISKATYLPIKAESLGFSTRYYWSGPGSVDVARLWPTVPAGFRKVRMPTVLIKGKKQSTIFLKGKKESIVIYEGGIKVAR
ncbi:MAG TPA: hypothetical protein VFI65_03570 [Streptosporangiaceae bacterium]|nr:hypothetical protein [Streptosporangiaceae bacterium]